MKPIKFNAYFTNIKGIKTTHTDYGISVGAGSFQFKETPQVGNVYQFPRYSGEKNPEITCEVMGIEETDTETRVNFLTKDISDYQEIVNLKIVNGTGVSLPINRTIEFKNTTTE